MIVELSSYQNLWDEAVVEYTLEYWERVLERSNVSELQSNSMPGSAIWIGLSNFILYRLCQVPQGFDPQRLLQNAITASSDVELQNYFERGRASVSFPKNRANFKVNFSVAKSILSGELPDKAMIRSAMLDFVQYFGSDPTTPAAGVDEYSAIVTALEVYALVASPEQVEQQLSLLPKRAQRHGRNQTRVDFLKSISDPTRAPNEELWKRYVSVFDITRKPRYQAALNSPIPTEISLLCQAALINKYFKTPAQVTGSLWEDAIALYRY
jgi:hypothetical protein